MTSNDYNEMRKRECDHIIPEVFHVHLPVKRFVCDDVEVGRDSFAPLFEGGNDLYVLITSARLRAERFFPPSADPRYFYNEGVRRYQQVYPHKKRWLPSEIIYYATQARYTPALVRIGAIEGLRRYSASTGSWQQIQDVSFRKVRVS